MRWVDAEVQIKLLKQEVAVKDARIAELENALKVATANQCECGPTSPPSDA